MFGYFCILILFFSFLFQIFILAIYPSVIQPMFNTFTNLPENSLKEKIELLAKRIEFPLQKIFVIDGSKRSSHSNAYFFGFWKNKRIVLFDTILTQCNEEEILAIVGHELGHWFHKHMLLNLIITQIYSFLMFYAFSFVIKNQQIYMSFGFNSTPTIIGFIIFQYLTVYLINHRDRSIQFLHL